MAQKGYNLTVILPAVALAFGLLLTGSNSFAHAAQQTPNADQAKNDTTDRNLELHIRRDVVRDKTLSMSAHNIKIIAQSGKVTLRGPVRNDVERQTVLGVARKYAGDGNVVDMLTLKDDSK